ncbi:hypothetical protein F4780DRAFT_175644 [Xylariomycetidae sp. FL0641]|nr:hypothetical protein F4780DRAFT_175644 [Xylariomycetidae sp. FL0641]
MRFGARSGRLSQPTPGATTLSSQAGLIGHCSSQAPLPTIAILQIPPLFVAFPKTAGAVGDRPTAPRQGRFPAVPGLPGRARQRMTLLSPSSVTSNCLTTIGIHATITCFFQNDGVSVQAGALFDFGGGDNSNPAEAPGAGHVPTGVSAYTSGLAGWLDGWLATWFRPEPGHDLSGGQAAAADMARGGTHGAHCQGWSLFSSCQTKEGERVDSTVRAA